MPVRIVIPLFWAFEGVPISGGILARVCGAILLSSLVGYKEEISKSDQLFHALLQGRMAAKTPGASTSILSPTINRV